MPDPISGPFIESWLYSALDGVRSITIDEGGGPVTLTLSANLPLTDALQDWEDQANAHGSLVGTYTFLSFELGATVFSRGDGPNFELELLHSLAAALGFSSATHTGNDNYVSDVTPLGRAEVMAANYSAPTRDHQVRERVYRWGRIATHRFNGSVLVPLEVTLLTSQALLLLDGPLFTSRMRVHQDGLGVVAYPNVPNFDGYLDLDIYGYPSKPRCWGVGDQYSTVRLLGIVRDQ